MALVEQERTIYQRVLTWVINKISRTILKSAFVAIAFVATGHLVVSNGVGLSAERRIKLTYENHLRVATGSIVNHKDIDPG